jgi:hypothetical protein
LGKVGDLTFDITNRRGAENAEKNVLSRGNAPYFLIKTNEDFKIIYIKIKCKA